jgi:PIN domain nuclease of toxin-antitoxin system
LRALVDTHSFLWALLHDHRLTATAKQVLTAPENELCFSLVSLWEIAIKLKTGKLNAIGSSVTYIRDEMKAYGLILLPIQYDHILQMEHLPRSFRSAADRAGAP